MYIGTTALPNLTDQQQRAVEFAVGGAPALWHDNLLREIYDVLGQTTPDSDTVLRAAINTVLADNGAPILHPAPFASTAILKNASSLGSVMTHRQTNNPADFRGSVNLDGFLSQKQIMSSTGPLSASGRFGGEAYKQ